jgi:hypothetical protein
MRYVLALAILSSAIPTAALQAASPGAFTAGVTAGTLGIGPEISYRANPYLAVRASATFLGVDGHGDVGDFRYDGSLRLRNFGGTIDLHPFAGDFRLSAGARATQSDRIRIHGMPKGPQTYGGVTYSPEQAGTLSADIHTAPAAPIFTLGYAHMTRSGFAFAVDGGVMFHGEPRVENLQTTGQLASNPAARDELNRQVQRLEDKISGYPFYPVVQLSIGHRF